MTLKTPFEMLVRYPEELVGTTTNFCTNSLQRWNVFTLGSTTSQTTRTTSLTLLITLVTS